MISPLAKYKIGDLVAAIVLAAFVAFLWLDLKLIREEVGAMQVERDFLALQIQEMRKDTEYLEKKLGDALLEAGILSRALAPKIADVRIVKVTAYSSTPDQTDDTPFVTASGTLVREGVVASNFLPFSTKIRLPEIFGGKTFTVEDRMKHDDRIDVWFPTREAALVFGVRNLKMEILEQ